MADFKHIQAPARDLRTAPPETLLSLREIVRPLGPAPVGRSRFLVLVQEGKAPKPALKAPKCTRWRWADIRDWLDAIVERGGL